MAMDEKQQESSGTGIIPLYRAWLCGSFRLERRVGSVYTMLDTKEWGGHSSPRTVLKALICAPRRRASRGTLLAQVWPEADGEQASRDLNVAISRLRKILRPVEEQECLTTENDSLGFSLAGQSVVWVDADAALMLLKVVERLGHCSLEAVPLLEEALHYFNRGAFLENDEGEWSANQRAIMERGRYRCRLWLAEAYVQQGNLGQAETILNELLGDDPTDEDVLGHLMQLLHQRGLTHQALVLSKQVSAFLAKEGLEISEATRMLATRLATERQILPMKLVMPGEIGVLSPSLLSFSNLSVPQDIILPYRQAGSLDMDQSRRKVVKQSLKLAGASIILSSMDASDSDAFERLLWILDKPSRLEGSSLTYLDQRTMYYWRDRDEVNLAPQDLLVHVAGHLQMITELLDEPLFPSARTHLCSTASKTALLYGALLYDLGDHEQARKVQDVAMRAALEAENYALQAVCGGWKSFTWINADDYIQALSCVQEANQIALQTSDSMVQAWLSAIEAEVQAHLSNRNACLNALRRTENSLHAPFSENTYALFKLNLVQFLGYKGVCLQQFYQKHDQTTHSLLQEAREALEQAIGSDALSRRKLTYLSDLAGVYARQGEIEKAYTYACQCITLISKVNSKMARQRLLQIRSLLQPYEDHSLVQDLDEQIVPLFSREGER
jgi:DNA-binding SARP family transcriptional activator